jgi:hypothetical protein
LQCMGPQRLTDTDRALLWDTTKASLGSASHPQALPLIPGLCQSLCVHVTLARVVKSHCVPPSAHWISCFTSHIWTRSEAPGMRFRNWQFCSHVGVGTALSCATNLGHQATEHGGRVPGSMYIACRSGVEAAGMGVDTDKHAATITKGSPGVLHGSFSLLLQDAEGQVIDPHSISAG